MSVMVLNFKAFSLIHNKVYKAIFHNECDSWYSQTIRTKFKNILELEDETKRLVESWIDLNEKSYQIRYREEIKTNYKDFWTIEQIQSTPLQLLKVLQSLTYQIEAHQRIIDNKVVYFFENDLQLTDQEQSDFEVLQGFKSDILGNVIANLPEYSELCWTGVNLKKIR